MANTIKKEKSNEDKVLMSLQITVGELNEIKRVAKIEKRSASSMIRYWAETAIKKGEKEGLY